MKPKERQGPATPRQQGERRDHKEQEEPRRVQQPPGQVSHPERKGEAGREPEEPHGDSEAV